MRTHAPWYSTQCMQLTGNHTAESGLVLRSRYLLCHLLASPCACPHLVNAWSMPIVLTSSGSYRSSEFAIARSMHMHMRAPCSA